MKVNESHLKYIQVAVQQKNKCTQIPKYSLLATILRQSFKTHYQLHSRLCILGPALFVSERQYAASKPTRKVT